MLVCVTGTPGTGKTGVCGALARKGHAVLPMDHLVARYGLGQGTDPVEVDTEALTALDGAVTGALDRALMALALGMHDQPGEAPAPKGSTGDHLFIDGHLSHYLPPAAVDIVVVLRRHPEALRPELETRDYSQEKVLENLEAECIDVTGQEAAAAHGRVVEFDGSEAGVDELCLGILSLKALWVGDYKGAVTDTREVEGGGGGKPPPPRMPGEIDFSEAILGWF